MTVAPVAPVIAATSSVAVSRRPHRRRQAALAAGVALAAGTVLGACGVSSGPDPAALSTGPDSTAEAPETTATTAPAGATTAPPTTQGPGGEAAGDAGILHDAAQATAEVTTLKMAMSVSLTGLPEGDTTVMAYEGAFDSAAQRAHLTLDLGDLLGTLGGGSGAMEMVIDGATAYVRSDLFSSMGDGKPWVSVSADELADGDALGAGGLGAGFDGPESFLQFLEGAGDAVETVGPEQVRGVDTTHLRTDVDLAALIAEAAPEEAAELEESLGELGAGGVVGTLPVDAWIDADGMVRRLRITFDLAGLTGLAGEAGAEVPEGMAEAAMVLDLELYDLGEPVEIVIPDPSEVGQIDGAVFGG